MILSQIKFRGLDRKGLDELKQYLVDGTVDVDEQGIVIVTAGSSQWDNELLDGDVTYETLKHIKLNDYRVGDTIDIVDTDLLFSETRKAMASAGIARTGGDKNADSNGETVDQNFDPDVKERMKIANEVYKKLIDEGHYKTYVVEGILDVGDKITGESELQVYTSLDNYFSETGYTEDQISGMEYQIDSKIMNRRAIDDIDTELGIDDGADFGIYMYLENLKLLQGFRNFNRVILMIAALVFALGAVNIINATAGNLHMRRKEFAQLRVIGMSRKTSCKNCSAGRNHGCRVVRPDRNRGRNRGVL